MIGAFYQPGGSMHCHLNFLRQPKKTGSNMSTAKRSSCSKATIAGSESTALTVTVPRCNNLNSVSQFEILYRASRSGMSRRLWRLAIPTAPDSQFDQPCRPGLAAGRVTVTHGDPTERSTSSVSPGPALRGPLLNTVLSGVERTGPPGGGPARVTGRRAPGERGAYRSTGHRSTETGNRRP